MLLFTGMFSLVKKTSELIHSTYRSGPSIKKNNHGWKDKRVGRSRRGREGRFILPYKSSLLFLDTLKKNYKEVYELQQQR